MRYGYAYTVSDLSLIHILYNNLNKLWAAGQIRKVSHPGMADRYDRTDKHDHLVCARCGKLLDINLADLTEQLQKQVNVPILAYDLKLIYLCESCQQEGQDVYKRQPWWSVRWEGFFCISSSTFFRAFWSRSAVILPASTERETAPWVSSSCTYICLLYTSLKAECSKSCLQNIPAG